MGYYIENELIIGYNISQSAPRLLLNIMDMSEIVYYFMQTDINYIDDERMNDQEKVGLHMWWTALNSMGAHLTYFVNDARYSDEPFIMCPDYIVRTAASDAVTAPRS